MPLTYQRQRTIIKELTEKNEALAAQLLNAIAALNALCAPKPHGSVLQIAREALVKTSEPNLLLESVRGQADQQAEEDRKRLNWLELCVRHGVISFSHQMCVGGVGGPFLSFGYLTPEERETFAHSYENVCRTLIDIGRSKKSERNVNLFTRWSVHIDGHSISHGRRDDDRAIDRTLRMGPPKS